MYCHYRQFLDVHKQQLYDWMYPALAAGIPRMDTGTWPPEQLHPVVKCLLLDRPELCHFEGRWEYRQGFLPHYTLAPDAIRILLEKAGAIPLPGEDSPLAVYDYLLENTVYDLNAPHSQSAWGALVEKRAVCKGIAKAYQLLLQLRNIPCILVEGSLDGKSRHVWNLVWQDGRWYHVDVTMGYPRFRQLVGGTDSRCGYDFAPDTAVHRAANPELLPQNSQGGTHL